MAKTLRDQARQLFTYIAVFIGAGILFEWTYDISQKSPLSPVNTIYIIKGGIIFALLCLSVAAFEAYRSLDTGRNRNRQIASNDNEGDEQQAASTDYLFWCRWGFVALTGAVGVFGFVHFHIPSVYIALSCIFCFVGLLKLALAIPYFRDNEKQELEEYQADFPFASSTMIQSEEVFEVLLDTTAPRRNLQALIESTYEAVMQLHIRNILRKKRLKNANFFVCVAATALVIAFITYIWSRYPSLNTI